MLERILKKRNQKNRSVDHFRIGKPRLKPQAELYESMPHPVVLYYGLLYIFIVKSGNQIVCKPLIKGSLIFPD